MKNFSLKFIDIMVGLILGLGFQWWPSLIEPWQYVAFIFVYFDIIDYWIDYSPSLKKFPPKREIDVFLDLSIMFILFLYIYATTISVVYFITAFTILRFLDYLWLLSSKHEYHPTGVDKTYVDTWILFDIIEVIVGIILIGATILLSINPLYMIIIYIAFRVIMRVSASLRYKKVHFV